MDGAFSTDFLEAPTLLSMFSFPLGCETRKLRELQWEESISPTGRTFQKLCKVVLGVPPWLWRSVWVYFTVITLPFSLPEPRGDLLRIFPWEPGGLPAGKPHNSESPPRLQLAGVLTLMEVHTQPPAIRQNSRLGVLSIHGSSLLRVSWLWLWPFNCSCLSRFWGGRWPCDLSSLPAPRTAVSFQCAQPFLAKRTEMMISKTIVKSWRRQFQDSPCLLFVKFPSHPYYIFVSGLVCIKNNLYWLRTQVRHNPSALYT